MSFVNKNDGWFTVTAGPPFFNLPDFKRLTASPNTQSEHGHIDQVWRNSS
ncbi:MAG TPA: hypothetical protein VH207_05555 [Chthoniobacterales bacterium]|jgi:hypothetical protein|nr:hypothetical protein [Chthoniobacterales bacterium]